MRIKIGTKILVCFIIITCLIISVSFIGLSEMNTISKRYYEIIHINLSTERLVEEIHALTLEQVAAVRGYIIYKDDKYSTTFNDLNKKAEEIYKEIET